MRAYDCVMIFKPNLGDEVAKKLIDSVNSWITTPGGDIIYSKSLGNRELAYPINKTTHGYYYHVQFLGSPAVLEEMRARIMVTENIVRDLIVRMDSLMTKDEVTARVERRHLVEEVAEEAAETTEDEATETEAAE
jgi:small subunit ribosomal protein S6